MFGLRKTRPGRLGRRSRSGIVAAALLATIAFGEAAVAPPASANPAIQGSTTENGLIYLPILSAGSVQAINPMTQKVVATIPDVGDHPLVMKTNEDHSKLFVTNFGPLHSYVTVIDLRTNRVIRKIGTLGPPYAVSQLSDDGRYLYVPTALSVVQVVDTKTLDVIRTLPILLPPGPIHLELSHDGTAMYVMTTAGAVTKYSTSTGALLAPPLFLNGIGPGWGGITPDGNTIYAVNAISGITFVDTRSWRVSHTTFLPIGSMPLSATPTPDGKYLWVCDFGTNDITEIDIASGAIVRVIRTDTTPVYAGFSASGRKAYVSTLGSYSNLPLPDLGLVKLPIAYIAQGQTGFLDTYDVGTFTRTQRMVTGGAPFGGVYPG